MVENEANLPNMPDSSADCFIKNNNRHNFDQSLLFPFLFLAYLLIKKKILIKLLTLKLTHLKVKKIYQEEEFLQPGLVEFIN